ncbi:SMODS domain-containing nucleotidyltransferase [Terribacillus saccharophilus]|uniref:SMODS domain-containing nucleotidyltransferase n=1 Tax=Terribacillus saccharophilus TaxID=361277 RepID=UPI000C9C04C2|nr:nucleotidyltransferase [Terribacillus goriensis]
MSVSENFSTFCNNLKMSKETIGKIQSRYKRITKRINLEYRNLDSENSYSLYVGSYGRGTEIWTSDIDLIVQLPYKMYEKYSNYNGNGQSALLQDVKKALQKTYPTSHVKGDGQVIGIRFDDGISFEIVPAFINTDGKSYTYPNTNNGGSWHPTNPRDEMQAMKNRNVVTNKNLKRLCAMARAWKGNCNVPISGILIDTLAYKFINDYSYKDKSFLYYDYLSRDFFKYLKDIDKEIEYWLAPGSARRVFKSGNFQYKAASAYRLSLEAIEYQEKKYWYSASGKWRDIFGTRYPE